MIAASIDIGSNSVLLSVSEVDTSKGLIEELVSESNVTALGRNVDKTGELSKEAMDETFEALKKYVEILKKYEISVESVPVTATEAARNAKNSRDFFSRIMSELGLEVKILSAEGEAFYTGLGVLSGKEIKQKFSGQREIVVMDIGGSSTELMRVRTSKGVVSEMVSLPVGSVRAKEWFDESCFDSKIQKIFSEYDLARFETKDLVCVAGSMTSLAAMMSGMRKFDHGKLEGESISFSDFSSFIDKIGHFSGEDLSLRYPFLGKRTSTIIAGARLAKVLIEKIKVENLIVSTQGLRHGLLVEGRVLDQFIVTG